ncbi:MAG TPA: FCD domain-containing protein [Casimicrobiaceae bacterium]|nr:FCD domain-containing protein [Casimicrobiaceae bacterium]
MRNHARPASLKDPSVTVLARELRQRLAGGEALPAERALADEYGVKRHRVRQALALLREQGDLDSSPRTNVADGESLIRSTNPLEVIELRLAFEPALARLAAVRATPLEIARIMRAATTPSTAQRSTQDLVFHKLVAAASGNGLAADFHALLRKVGSDARVRVQTSDPPCPNRLAQRDREHHAVAEAIAARDPEGAEAAMRAHLNAVHRIILNRLTAANAA